MDGGGTEAGKMRNHSAETNQVKTVILGDNGRKFLANSG